jgi:hypothetical protein
MRLRDELGLLGAVVAGAAIRLDQIREQIVLDDEWHALHALMRFGYGRLLTHFGWTDFCIPLAVYDKVVKDTVGLSEMWMRLPVLLAGIGALVVIPLMARRGVGRAASTSLAWLLAVSPLHVFLSRFARPYAISLLLVTAGALALARWWEGGGAKWGTVGAAGFVLAPYFHLSALPPVLAVLGLGLLDAARGRETSARRPRELVRLVAMMILGLALSVGVPLAVDHAALTYKTGHAALGVSTLVGSLELLTGTARIPLLALLATLSLAGGVVLARDRLRLLALLSALALAGPAAILLARPAGVEEPIVAVRYCIAALPAALLLVAVALARAEERMRAHGIPCPHGILTALTVAALVLAGPLPRIHARPNNWTNHGWYQYAYDPARLSWHCPQEVPAFYQELARQPPGSLRIVEAPWWHAWPNLLYPCYQSVHRQYMAIGFVSPLRRAAASSGLPLAAELPLLAPDGSFRFRNFVHVSDEAGLQQRGIRYVVFHLSLEREMGVDSVDYRGDAAPWIEHYRSRYGRPVYEDGTLVAFDVAPPSPAGR